MWGARKYVLAAGSVALVLGLLWTLLFAAQGRETMIFVAVGWAPMAFVGVVGGGLAVASHGRSGAAFPLTLVTCIFLRLFLGLGGVALASRSGQVKAHLTSLLGTFVTMQVFEMIWFLKRQRGLDSPAERQG